MSKFRIWEESWLFDIFDSSFQKLSEVGKYMPESIHKVWIVKPNWLFHTLFAIIKPFINPDTVAKVFENEIQEISH